MEHPRSKSGEDHTSDISHAEYAGATTLNDAAVVGEKVWARATTRPHAGSI